MAERIAIYANWSEAERRHRLCVGLSRFVSATVYITANTGRLAIGISTDSKFIFHHVVLQATSFSQWMS
jgi:hypothetical protein